LQEHKSDSLVKISSLKMLSGEISRSHLHSVEWHSTECRLEQHYCSFKEGSWLLVVVIVPRPNVRCESHMMPTHDLDLWPSNWLRFMQV